MKGLAFVGALVVGLVAFTLVGLLAGFLIMIGLGVLHSVFPAIPAIGFGEAVLVYMGLTLITAPFRGKNEK